MRRVVRPVALFLSLALFSLTILSSQAPTPPVQPASGPGGKQYVHTSVTKNRYGKGGQEYWIFEPDTPKPAAAAPLIVLLHGWGGMNPIVLRRVDRPPREARQHRDLSALPGEFADADR